MKTFIDCKIDDKRLVNSSNNPQDTVTIQNFVTTSASSMLRSNETNVKAITESTSSGFCSNTDNIELDYDIFNLFTNPFITQVVNNPENNKSNDVSQDHYDEEIKNIVNEFDTELTNKQLENAILVDKHEESWLTGITNIAENSEIKSDFNFDDNVLNLNECYTFNALQQGITTGDPSQFLNLSNNGFFEPNMNDKQSNLIDPSIQMWSQINESLLNSINLANMSNFNDLCLNATSNIIPDVNNNVNVLVNGMINPTNSLEGFQMDCKNNQKSLQDLTSLTNGISLENYNNQLQGQNIIVRYISNGQIQYAAIDPANLQNNILANLRTNNLNDPVNFTDISKTKISGQNLIANANLFFNNDTRKVEPIDLMENPSNWRRMPNNGGYQCNLCNKSYTRKYGLKIHLRIHSGFKPLECKVCQKKFGDPSNMAKHIRLHSSDGSPYKCTLCDKPLVRRRDLERHMRSRHPDITTKGPSIEGKRIF